MSEQHDESYAVKECYRYNSYVRKKYLVAIEKLLEEEITRDRGASFPSLLDINIHVLNAYKHWFFYRYGLTEPEGLRPRGAIKSIQELKEEENKIFTAIMAFVEGLAPSDVAKTFETSDETHKWRFTLGQMLWHLVEEELQHRGEMNALLWQMDIDPPITDWLDWKTEIGVIKPLS